MATKKYQLEIFFGLKKKVHYIETYVDPRNVFAIRKLGLDLLLNFVDVMADACDDKVFDLANHVLDFSIFADEKVKLPSFQVRVIEDKDRLKIQVNDKPPTEQEQLQFLSMFFAYIRSNDDQFSFWWKFFKSRIAPILYPHECQSLELLDKMDGKKIKLKNKTWVSDNHLLLLIKFIF
jgi:hypothetical protein